MAVETTPNWAPLEQRLVQFCAEFMWMYRENGIEHYKHRDTRRYLLLAEDGRCLRRTAKGFEEVPFEEEWNRVTGRVEGSN